MQEGYESGPTGALTPEQVRQLADLSLDILTISGSEGRFTWVNAAAERVLGWSAEELTTRPYFEFLHPDDVERTQQGLGAVLNGESVLDFENRYLHKDGDYRWLSWRCGPISEDGVLVATARDVTEHRLLRAAAASGADRARELAEREAQLRAAEGRGGLGSWTWNPATNEVRWSASLYRLLGLPESEPPSFERFFELVHPDDVERVMARARAASEDGTLPPQRYRLIRAGDGALREIVSTGGTPITDEAGNLLSMAGALLDITDQVEAERRLRRSEAKLREAQRMANVGHWRWDFVTLAAEWSEQMYRIYDARPGQEMDSERFYAHMHPGDRARVQTAAREAIATAQPFETSFRLLQVGHGTVRHVRMAARPEQAPDGRLTGFVGIIHDVTELQQAEEALLRSEWVLREAQQAAGIGSWTFDPAAGAVEWSDEMYRLNGVPRGDAPDMTRHLDLVTEADRAIVEAAGLDAPNRDLRGLSYRIQRASDGAVRHVTTATRVLRDDAGNPLLVIGTTMDVSEQRRLEEQLRHAQKMEAIGRLAGGIAHDFNNTLTAIVGNADLARLALEDGTSPDDHLDAVIQAGEQAAGVTRQLLAFARRQIVQPQILDPAERLESVRRLLRPMLGEAIALEVRPECGDGRIRMDAGQLEQLLINLAVNARDAMPNGGSLTVGCTRVQVAPGSPAAAAGAAPGDYVELTVRDTGSGMTPEVQEHIFDPFFTTKETGRGTGLGLATCHGIVTQNHGVIVVESTPGEGTTFRIFLPHVADMTPAPDAGAPAPDESLRGTEAILLVEDEPPVRQMAAAALRRFGYRVREAGSGAEAIAAGGTEDPVDLLFTDVVLPDMRGPQVAAAVRERHPGCVVLFASGYTEDSIVRDGVLDAGVNFLPKPFTPRALARRVRELLDAP